MKKKRRTLKQYIKESKDKILETLIVTAIITVFVALLIITWINVVFGLKVLATAVIVLIAAVLLTIATKEEKTDATTEDAE